MTAPCMMPSISRRSSSERSSSATGAVPSMWSGLQAPTMATSTAGFARVQIAACHILSLFASRPHPMPKSPKLGTLVTNQGNSGRIQVVWTQGFKEPAGSERGCKLLSTCRPTLPTSTPLEEALSDTLCAYLYQWGNHCSHHRGLPPTLVWSSWLDNPEI